MSIDKAIGFLSTCDQRKVSCGDISVHYLGDKLTVSQLHRIIQMMIEIVGWNPEWDDSHVLVGMCPPKDAVILAQAIQLAWSPAERYETGISVAFTAGELDGPVVLVLEVTAGEGRVGA